MKDPCFLTLAEAVEIHQNQIELYGGDLSLRDIRLLQSALAQPEATFEGQWLHTNIFEMAAAYAFHIAQNHPFVDGNKRTALAAALIFLEINGISVLDPSTKLYDAMIKISSGKMKKPEFAQLLKLLSGEKGVP